MKTLKLIKRELEESMENTYKLTSVRGNEYNVLNVSKKVL